MSAFSISLAAAIVGVGAAVTGLASGANATDGTVRKPAFPPASTGLRGYQMSDSHH
jgi:hypothetical protein